MKQIALLLCCVFTSISSFSQNDLETEKLAREADKAFRAEHFTAALPLYKELLQKDTTDINYLFRTGICYLRTNINKGLACAYFEKLLEAPEPDPVIHLLTGTAYQYAYRFDEAKAQYELYLNTLNPKDDKTTLIKRKIESCDNAIELMKYPQDVTLTNIGTEVNSTYPDYYPFVPHNESFVVFNSKRQGAPNALTKGYYPSDVYWSEVKNGEFTRATPLEGALNTVLGNEDIVGLSGDGSTALFFLDNDQAHGDLYLGKLNNGKVDSLYALPEAINSTTSIEAAASLSADGKAIYFASDREGGLGGFDLYITRLLPTGSWSEPENMGPNINTPYNEDFPNIAPDGKTLYFSSKGHTSMGGYDIFSSHYEPEKKSWTLAKNIGVPVNTPDDDMNFRVSITGRYGYISSLRENGAGDLDLYRLTFNNISERFTVIKGYIYNADKAKQIDDINITVEKQENNELVGQYLPNPTTGRYIVILPPGHYQLTITSGNSILKKEVLKIADKSGYTAEVNKDFILE